MGDGEERLRDVRLGLLRLRPRHRLRDHAPQPGTTWWAAATVPTELMIGPNGVVVTNDGTRHLRGADVGSGAVAVRRSVEMPGEIGLDNRVNRQLAGQFDLLRREAARDALPGEGERHEHRLPVSARGRSYSNGTRPIPLEPCEPVVEATKPLGRPSATPEIWMFPDHEAGDASAHDAPRSSLRRRSRPSKKTVSGRAVLGLRLPCSIDETMAQVCPPSGLRHTPSGQAPRLFVVARTTPPCRIRRR